MKNTGDAIIYNERALQLYKGHDPESDLAKHQKGELIVAALCYLCVGRWSRSFINRIWPWPDKPYEPPEAEEQPHERIQRLAKAGALIAAEIDRLQLEALDADDS